MENNIYSPFIMEIINKTDEAPLVKTLRLKFKNKEDENNFSFKAGQFAEYGIFGVGECPFCIASSPTQFEREKYIECTFRVAGKVTSALANLDIGDAIGIRAPYGTIFPIEEWKGKNIIFATGGIALPPIRSVIWNLLDRKSEFGHISIIYGAKTTHDIIYKREIALWENMDNVTMIKTVDPGGEDKEWNGKIDFFPTTLKEYLSKHPEKISRNPREKEADDVYQLKDNFDINNTIVVVCGPPFVITMCLNILEKFKFSLDKVYTTLENRMKCGLGKCGRCNIGSIYVCKEGPVFTASQVKKMLPDF